MLAFGNNFRRRPLTPQIGVQFHAQTVCYRFTHHDHSSAPSHRLHATGCGCLYAGCDAALPERHSRGDAGGAMPCPEQAAAQPRLQDRVQSPKYRRHTDSGECPPDRAPAGYSQYEFLNALIPDGYSFTVALADEEATRRLMVNIAATLSNRTGKRRRNQFSPDDTCIVRNRQRPTG